MLISVIVPALNEAGYILESLASARAGYSPAEVELIVVDGGSTDGTPRLIPGDARLLAAPRGRAVQLNCGARASRGEVLLFLHADTRLPAGWREAVVGSLRWPEVSGGAFQIRIVPALGPLHLLNHLRLPADWRLMFGDQAQFARREAFFRVGGFPEIPLMEDLELARRLGRVGRLARLPLRVSSSSRRFREVGSWRQTWLNLSLVFRYLYCGQAPADLARSYRSSRELV